MGYNIEKEVEEEGYIFDTEYFKSMRSEANQVIFKLVKEGKKDVYLHLYNDHNGYYYHGFEFLDSNKNIIKSSDI